MPLNVLVIDDQRSFKGLKYFDDQVTYARNLDEMMTLLPPFDDTKWDEIWLDFDMGEKETTYDFLNRWIWDAPLRDVPNFDPLFYVHSMNIVGAQMLVDFLHDHYFKVKRVIAGDYMEVTE